MTQIHLIIKKSFGPLQFGASTIDAESSFGQCEESEELEGFDGNSIVWHYLEKGFSLFFDCSQNNRFSSVEIAPSANVLSWDISPFSLNEKQLKDLFVQNGFKKMEQEQHEWGEKRITFDDAMADFYFQNGKMVSINLSSVL